MISDDAKSYVHGLVLFTFSDDSTRSSVRKFIQDKLDGIEINESSYSLPRSGDKKALDMLKSFCKNEDLKCCEDDFLKVCYSGALNNNEQDYKDQLVIYTVIKGNVNE